MILRANRLGLLQDKPHLLLIKVAALLLLLLVLLLSGCSASSESEADSSASSISSSAESQEPNANITAKQDETMEEESSQISDEQENLRISVNGHEMIARFEDNPSAVAFRELLTNGPMTVDMHDYASMEKVGSLGSSLVRSDEQITTEPGDVILYQGNQITIYYGTNTWNFTRLARINDVSGESLRDILGAGDVSATFSID